MTSDERIAALEEQVKRLWAARDADLDANSTLFVRLHNLEQRVEALSALINKLQRYTPAQ